MDPIPKERMGNATSSFNLMRNLGGSIGIATTGSLLARKQQEYVNIMGEHVTPFSQTAQNALESARAAFLASGADAVTATQRAYAAVFGTVQRHATMLAFVDVFRLLGMMFLLLLPLVMLMRRPRGRAAAAAH